MTRRSLLALAAPLLLTGQAPRRGLRRPATLALLGDLMLGRDVSAALARHSPEWIWGDALKPLQAAEAAIANLESPITTSTVPSARTPKWYHFRAEPEAVKVLSVGRVRLVSLANNHILDHGERGLEDTRRLLAASGIAFAGAGPDLAAAQAPAFIELPDCRIGVIAATDQMPEFAARADRPGTWHIAVGPDSPALSTIAAHVGAMRDAGADLIVLSLHWGPNLRRTPTAVFRAFARAAIAAGVDVVHGHSAHLVQGVERAGRGVILYDTGNMIDDYWRFVFVRQDWCFLFLLDHERGRLRRLRLLPFVNQPMPLHGPDAPERAAMIARMRALCAEHGTAVEETAEGLAIPLGEAG